MVGSYKSVQ